MKFKIKYVFWLVLAIVFIGAFTFFDYVLPETRVVNVSGIEVKRMDNDGVINADNPADGPTRDVYFIYTINPKTKESYVYRNEDTGWGFPFYFKFNSADVQADAQSLSKNDTQLARVTSYGWRITLFSTFPNALWIEPTDSPDKPFPLFSVIFLSALVLFIVLTYFFIRRKLKKRRASRSATTTTYSS